MRTKRIREKRTSDSGETVHCTSVDEQSETDDREGYVEYETGLDREQLAASYGVDVGIGEARQLEQLESEHGRKRVERWADEGMPVDAMG